MDKHFIIEEIKRTAAENGNKPLGREKFCKVTGINSYEWLGKYWARWGDALAEAGYEPNKLQDSFSDDFIIEKFISLIQESGKFPVDAELRIKRREDKDFPSHGVFSKFGKKSELVKKVIDYCVNKGDLEQVIEICKPFLAKNEPDLGDLPETSNAKIDEGFVYLIQSGRNYKIGKTYDIGRRKYDLKIQLPDPIKEIHSIRTDDPNGIETYWHGRFQAKRKNGEWFELTPEDVKAFKKRNFM